MENATMTMEMTETATYPHNDTSAMLDPDFHYYQLANDVFIWVDPFLTIGGLFGNMLTFLVMRRPASQTSSVAIFLSALAIADSLVLIFDFINNWFKYALKIYLLRYDGFCQFHRWFFPATYSYAAWLVTAVSCERFIAVSFPIKARNICTKRVAVISIYVMPVILGVIYINQLWSWEISEDGQCDVKPSHLYFLNHIHPWLSAVLYSYGPIIIIIITNIIIIYKLIQARKKRRSLSVAGQKTIPDVATQRISITVVVISVAYVLTTIPVSIWYTTLFAADEFTYHGPKKAFIETIILIIGLSNHAINFFLYVLSSTIFRTELCIMLHIRKPVIQGHNPSQKKYSVEVQALGQSQSRSTSLITLSSQSSSTLSSASSHTIVCKLQDPPTYKKTVIPLEGQDSSML